MELGSYENSQDVQPEAATSTVQKSQAEVNIEEAPVTADEVMRAGRFGATDAINSILPAASNSTDFGDHLQKVQVLEDSVIYNKAQDTFEVANTESSAVDSDSLVRAGGFGATDNISSFLPVASDFTDFEASLRDARDYEDLKEEIARPGLGWTNQTK